MDFYENDDVLYNWIGEDFSIILENYEEEDIQKLENLINNDLAKRSNYPLFELNEHDTEYIEILDNELKKLNNDIKNINKHSAQYMEATYSAKQKYFDIKNSNFPKNFIFKNEIVNNKGLIKHYQVVSCYVWRKLEESAYGEEWERTTLNLCRDNSFENYYDVDYKCHLSHLVFSDEEIDNNLISNDNIDNYSNLTDDFSKVDDVIHEYAQDNNLNGFHIKKLVYNYSSVLELFIPKFNDINVDQYKVDSELFNLKTSFDLDKPKLGEQQKISRQCIYEGCNIYLNQLNTGFLCKKHQEMNTDKKNEYSNPNEVSPLFKEYLEVHFKVLDKIKNKHPGLWPILRSEIMNTLFVERSDSSENSLQYKISKFYNDISPYIRWYLREEIKNEINISHLSNDLQTSTIRIEGTLSNIQIDIWENQNKIKNNCLVPDNITNLLLVENKACKSRKKKDKYLYRDVETASLFIREDQEIYQCPKSIGFHIKSKN